MQGQFRRNYLVNSLLKAFRFFLSSLMVGIEHVHSSMHGDMSIGCMSQRKLVKASVALGFNRWRSYRKVNLLCLVT